VLRSEQISHATSIKEISRQALMKSVAAIVLLLAFSAIAGEAALSWELCSIVRAFGLQTRRVPLVPGLAADRNRPKQHSEYIKLQIGHLLCWRGKRATQYSPCCAFFAFHVPGAMHRSATHFTLAS
jgi:hypothetical protein